MKKLEKKTEVYVCDGCGAEYENETVCRMCEESHRYKKLILYLRLKDMSWHLVLFRWLYANDPKEEVWMAVDDEMTVEDGLSVNWIIVTEDVEKSKEIVKKAALKWLADNMASVAKMEDMDVDNNQV